MTIFLRIITLVYFLFSCGYYFVDAVDKATYYAVLTAIFAILTHQEATE